MALLASHPPGLPLERIGPRVLARMVALAALVVFPLGAWSAAPVGFATAELKATDGSAGQDPGETDRQNRGTDEPTITWRGEWRGWNGFYFDLIRRTLLGGWAPGLTNVTPIHPRLWGREAETHIPYHADLTKTRMAGKIGAKVAVDAAAFSADDELGEFDAGVELRRARVYAQGDCLIVLPVSYEIEIGYIPNEFHIENSYLEFRDLGFLGTLKVGQYQVPMTLENVQSSRDRTFMETPAPLQALAPGIEAGLQVGRPILRQRATWAAGLFTEGFGNDFGDATKDFGRAVVRLTGLLMDTHEDSPRERLRLLHVGLSGYGLYAGADSVRYRSRPESHLAPTVVDTRNVDADGAFVLGAEMAWVDGPLSAQAEFLHAWAARREGGDVGFHGFYLSGSWFVTGETRPYHRSRGAFARVIPHRQLALRSGGWGALEFATRFSYVDLVDGDVRGGRMMVGMVGINWYLHSHMKWRLDAGWGHANGGPPDGSFSILQTRLEMDL